MPDALEIEVSNVLKNIVRWAEDMILEHRHDFNPERHRISSREDTQLAFVRNIRGAVKRAGYKSPEEHWNDVMAAKKLGFEDGVKWARTHPIPPKKRKLKIVYTCSDRVHHEHRWKWSAWLCGRIQYLCHLGVAT